MELSTIVAGQRVPNCFFVRNEQNSDTDMYMLMYMYMFLCMYMFMFGFFYQKITVT